MTTRVRSTIALVAVAVLLAVPMAVFGQATGLSTDFFGRLNGNGPAPTLSTCGTAPTIAGTDTAGKITIGTGTPSACTMTFARAYANAPSCRANDDTTIAKNPTTVTTTTTAATITLTAASVNGDVISYMCVGF